MESGLDIEGGIAFGSISKDLLEAEDNQNFFITDITGRWHFKLSPTDTALAGLDGMELAAGISYVDPDYDINNNETIYLRFGPAFNFGEHTRIQINGEIEDPAAEGLESTFLLRSQATFNF
ncbi:MAG: hypothetical protein GWN16_16075 [Calditrichae bacterium]|nr:hypothetical protein [Calditrichia bacterium]